ncbi:iron response transcriptional regulator IrrA (plasmid) [Rhizobium leguminosarum]|uniref:iron response transcriptional regulator IrrA n=1 Tax=Rhizobium leguminosarum TaxID=384 RepID=UPI00103EE3DB|nr:Fur family transcriptional regulator [Rhizobium leguminosarum]MBP2490789.1 Fur family iron response transcriptional regulator [Rhizobium leguminosarum]MBY5496081.1 transcriptional repressor [Rhizobium leguminosarum]TCA43128.1 transcriptional repressor [Rhizobium leguminosarum bv. viciae]
MPHQTTTLQRLRSAGLRPTQQRIALANLLFAGGHRHVTAEELHAEAREGGFILSLATVYNTLNQFTDAGLVRVLAVEGLRTWFDTNVAEHFHFYIEGRGEILDVPDQKIAVLNPPDPPEGFDIVNIDIVIRLRPISGN